MIRSSEENRRGTTTIRPLSSRSSGLLIVVAPLPCGTRSTRNLRRHRRTKMWWQRRGGRPASRGLARRNGICHCPRRRLLLLLCLLRVEERRVRSGDRRRRRRLLSMSLVLLIVVPGAVAIVLLLLADVGLCRLCRLHLCLCRLAGRLGVRVGVEGVCAWSVRVGTSVLVPGKVGISVIRVVGLSGRLAGGDNRCGSGGRSRRR